MATQQFLDFTPAARERAAQIRKREGRAQALLARLREGAAPRSEVKRLGGDRFSARIDELRRDYYVVGPVKAPRWGITEVTEPYPDGEDMYVLVEPPPAGWRPRGGRP